MASNTSPQKRLKTSHEVDRISNLPNSVLHKSQSLNKFCLVCEGVTERLNVTAWLSTAIARDVQVLDICVVCSANNNFIALPGSLFTCTSLEFLKLDGDFLVQVPCLVSLPRLEGLNLKGVRFQCDESVRKFIEGCPVLKSLYIDRTRYDNVVVLAVSSPTLKHLEIKALFHDYPEGVFQKLEINAPLLEYLHVADYVSDDCTVKGLTSLTELRLFDDSPFHEVDPGYCFDMVDKVSQAPHRLKFLTLGQNLGVGNIPPIAKFSSITKLTVNTKFLESEDLLRLLKSSVHLQVFELEELSDSAAIDETWENHVPECLSWSLQKYQFQSSLAMKVCLE